ncbi:MAG: poly-gamma-glutamate biosynthesis protein PgsC [Lawsonibacter sp.]|nr:poly-gamma-glutamate biosynthesis protein PgsC [Lawsonibacter sp.]
MYNQIILAGVLVSLLFTEATGLSAGLVVPGYLVLSLHAPWRLAYTLAVAAAAAGLCRLLSRAVILYGRRRFALLLALTFLLDLVLGRSGLLPVRLSLVGLLIPGIIAREMDRQGFGDTLLSLAAVTAVLALLAALMGYPVFR